ncbi:MAG: hypothetical protein QM535_21815 [Limnohabitans sp.]|nr:hypothetical protein [Limnohabitans sp.]
MKKYFWFLVFFVGLTTTFCKAQNSVVVGEIAPMDMFLIGIEKNDATYILTYKDQHAKNFNELKSFSFKENMFESFYTTIIKGFETMPTDTKLDFSGVTMLIHYEKQSGQVMAQFKEVDKSLNAISFSQFLSQNQISTIFGKKH